MKIETLVIGFFVVWAIGFPIAIVLAIKRIKKFGGYEYKNEERLMRLSKIQPFLKSLKITGWGLLIVGSIILLTVLPSLFDSNASINVNGEPIKDFLIKLLVATFASIFPAIGALIVFSPKQKIENMFLGFQGFTEQLYKSQKFK